MAPRLGGTWHSPVLASSIIRRWWYLPEFRRRGKYDLPGPDAHGLSIWYRRPGPISHDVSVAALPHHRTCMLYRFRGPLHVANCASTLSSLKKVRLPLSEPHIGRCGRSHASHNDQANMLRIINHEARSRVNNPKLPVSRPFYVFLLRFALSK